MFKIAEIAFEVRNARLDAFIDSDNWILRWGVEIEAFGSTGEFERWQPSMKSEVLITTKPAQLRSYLDLAGTKLHWNDKEDSDGEPFGLLYVFEHEPIYQCEIKFLEKSDSLHFSLSGKSDLNYNEKYNNNISLNIETKLDFIGIWCGREPEKVCRKRLEPFFDQEFFVFTQTEHGVSLLRPNK